MSVFILFFFFLLQIDASERRKMELWTVGMRKEQPTNDPSQVTWSNVDDVIRQTQLQQGLGGQNSLSYYFII